MSEHLQWTVYTDFQNESNNFMSCLCDKENVFNNHSNDSSKRKCDDLCEFWLE